LRGTTGIQGLGGPTGPQGLVKAAYNWLIYNKDGIGSGKAFVVYTVQETVTVTKATVDIGDSGFGGSAATYFQFHILPGSSLPLSPPPGAGSFQVVVPAVGAGVMNSASSTINQLLTAGQILVVTVNIVPDTLANYAQISLRG
jgi:hypothetical protein